MFKVTTMLVLACLANLISSNLASAEVYKWKDKNGVTRYSDVPPNDLPSQPLKPKKAKPANVKTVVPQSGTTEATTQTPSTKPNDVAAKGKPLTQEEAANKRQAEAEKAKKEAEVRAAEKKEKDDNCATAKANLNTFATGGRVVRVNENGEREFFDDAGIAKGLEQAKADVDKYCS